MSEEKTFPCFICESNGFPNTPIVLKGKDDRGKPIRVEPGSHAPHKHKNKLGGGYQQQVPMTQPLSNQNQNAKTKDEMIAQYHQENQEGYAAYRKVMQEQVDATRFLAESIIELARAMRDKGAVQTEE